MRGQRGIFCHCEELIKFYAIVSPRNNRNKKTTNTIEGGDLLRKFFLMVVALGLGIIAQETAAQGLGRIGVRLGRLGQPAANSSASISSEDDSRQAREMEEDRTRSLMVDSIRLVYRAERAKQDSTDLANYLAEQERQNRQGEYREPTPSFPVNGSELDRFLWAMAHHVESGGYYDAKNISSGAYGKYQFMPSTWRYWSIRCFGYIAEQTPENQEKVARFKAQTLYGQYGRWRDVASIWFSGQPYWYWSNPRAVSDGYTNLEDYCNIILRSAGLN